MEISSVHLFITINDDFGEMFDACVRRFRKKCLFFFVCKKIVPFFLRFFIFFLFFVESDVCFCIWICIGLVLRSLVYYLKLLCKMMCMIHTLEEPFYWMYIARSGTFFCQMMRILRMKRILHKTHKHEWLVKWSDNLFAVFFFFILWNVTILNHFDFVFFFSFSIWIISFDCCVNQSQL